LYFDGQVFPSRISLDLGVDKEEIPGVGCGQGLNKKALQQLSMLERRIAKGKAYYSHQGISVTMVQGLCSASIMV